MTVLDRRKMRDEKVSELKAGRTVYAESPELIRLIKRGIDREEIRVNIETTSSGCWFTSADNN